MTPIEFQTLFRTAFIGGSQIFFEAVSREFLLAAPADIVAVLPALFVARVRFETRFVALFCPVNARATVGITGAKSRWIT